MLLLNVNMYNVYSYNLYLNGITVKERDKFIKEMNDYAAKFITKNKKAKFSITLKDEYHLKNA